MAELNDAERLLVESIANMLQHDAKLGLSMHDKQLETMGETERGYEYLHGQIDEMYALKAAELTFCDSACQAFNKVHAYKYLEDPTFHMAMEKELTAQGIPAEDRRKALDIVPAIIEELKSEQESWAERDFGFSKHMDDMRRVSQPQQFKS